MKNFLCFSTGVIGSTIAYLLGGFDSGLKALLICMAADYITGLLVAGVFKKSGKTKSGALSSQAGWKGLAKKGVSLLVVAVACQLDSMTGHDFIRNAAIIGFMANEVISITENAGLMGVPIPPVITKAIEILKSKGEKENDN